MIRAVCLILVSSVAASASAQTQAQTPAATPAPASKTPQRREPPQTMNLTVSLSGSDMEDGASGNLGTLPVSGFHTDADAILSYKRNVGRATIDASGRSVSRYTPSSQTLSTTYDQAQLGFSMVTAHNRFHGRQMVSFSPYYQFGALPDATVSPIAETAQSHGDFANSPLRAIGSTTGIDFTRTISHRNTLSFAYNLRRTTFGEEGLDMTYQGGDVLFLHQFTRSVALRTGYGYRSSTSTLTQMGLVHTHNLDLGLDYKGALGYSKRTTLRVVSGVSATPTDHGTIFNPTGSIALARQIGRTWRAEITANRAVEVLEGFTEPAVRNSGTVDFSGKLSRRASVSASAVYTTGVVGVDAPGANSYQNWAGTTGLRLMLSRWTAVDAQYSAYQHHFDQGVQLAPGMVSGLKRHGFRVSFTWLRPVLQ